MRGRFRRGQGKEDAVLRIILVRHGQTEWNAGGSGGEYFRGQIDVPLNGMGEAQARAVAERLADVRIAAVYASPLQRAQRTALPIAEARGLAVARFGGLLDIDYGEWGGRAHAEVAAEQPSLYAQWRSTPHRVQIPGGESLDDVRARVCAGLEEVVRRHQDEIVALVGHQVVNKVLLCAVLGLDNRAFWRIRQDTCCINRFDHDGGAFTLLTMNEVGHLPAWPGELDRLPTPATAS
jgi:broad specificity phosphatase PhoE